MGRIITLLIIIYHIDAIQTGYNLCFIITTCKYPTWRVAVVRDDDESGCICVDTSVAVVEQNSVGNNSSTKHSNAVLVVGIAYPLLIVRECSCSRTIDKDDDTDDDHDGNISFLPCWCVAYSTCFGWIQYTGVVPKAQRERKE